MSDFRLILRWAATSFARWNSGSGKSMVVRILLSVRTFVRGCRTGAGKLRVERSAGEGGRATLWSVLECGSEAYEATAFRPCC